MAFHIKHYMFGVKKRFNVDLISLECFELYSNYDAKCAYQLDVVHYLVNSFVTRGIWIVEN